ncbi:hypothetical protein [Humidesulfovibrio sp.]
MIRQLTLATLAQAIVLPCLSRRTGKPCRSVITRQLLLGQAEDDIQLTGCLDPQGRVHRTAVRDVLSVQRRLVIFAEPLGGAGRVWQEFEALPPAAFSLDATGSPYQSVSLGSRDTVELIGAWPSTCGDITAMLRPVCGMLISAADSVLPPFRQIGHLWPHGDFARPSGSLVLSFAPALVCSSPPSTRSNWRQRSSSATERHGERTGSPMLRPKRIGARPRAWPSSSSRARKCR